MLDLVGGLTAERATGDHDASLCSAGEGRKVKGERKFKGKVWLERRLSFGSSLRPSPFACRSACTLQIIIARHRIRDTLGHDLDHFVDQAVVFCLLRRHEQVAFHVAG